MKYLLLAIINAIYGVLLLLTLSSDTPGFYLVLIIGLVLIVMGLSGLILWLRLIINENKDQPESDTLIKSWFSLIKSFDIVLVAGLLFRAVILQPYIVDGDSMEPNFHNKEIMLVDKITYRLREPQRGETIIFQAPKDPNSDYIKRVIGLPGDTVVITKGKIFINGTLISETYLPAGLQTNNESSTDVFRQTMGPEEYFVLGDNRGNSSDSREWGILPKINIVGKAWYIIYPSVYRGKASHTPPTFERDQQLKNYVSTIFSYSHKLLS